MTQDEIIEANKRSAQDAEHDWAKEERRVEVRTDEQFGYVPGRHIGNPENYPGQELNEIERENVEASRNK
jgi:hypothetical protein